MIQNINRKKSFPWDLWLISSQCLWQTSSLFGLNSKSLPTVFVEIVIKHFQFFHYKAKWFLNSSIRSLTLTPHHACTRQSHHAMTWATTNHYTRSIVNVVVMLFTDLFNLFLFLSQSEDRRNCSVIIPMKTLFKFFTVGVAPYWLRNLESH